MQQLMVGAALKGVNKVTTIRFLGRDIYTNFLTDR